MNAFPDLTKTLAADSKTDFSSPPKQPKKSGTNAFEKHLDKPDFQERETEVDPLDGSTNPSGASAVEPTKPVEPPVSDDEKTDVTPIVEAETNGFLTLLGDLIAAHTIVPGEQTVADQSNQNLAISGVDAGQTSDIVSAQAITSTTGSIATAADPGAAEPIVSIIESSIDGAIEAQDQIQIDNEPTNAQHDSDAALIEANSSEGNFNGNTPQSSDQKSAETLSANNAAASANEREIANAERLEETSSTNANADATDAAQGLPTGSENSHGNQSQSQNQGSESSIVSQTSTETSTSNFQQPQAFTTTLTQAAQRATEIEAPISLQPVSEPTSQLKVAILANAASIENDSTHTIQVDLHPAELGRLQIRIDQTGDQLTAKIVATEIASSELLMQDRQHLVQALNELGFGEASLDISHGDPQNPNNDEEIPKDSRSFDAMSEDSGSRAAPTLTSIRSTGVDFVA